MCSSDLKRKKHETKVLYLEKNDTLIKVKDLTSNSLESLLKELETIESIGFYQLDYEINNIVNNLINNYVPNIIYYSRSVLTNREVLKYYRKRLNTQVSYLKKQF